MDGVFQSILRNIFVNQPLDQMNCEPCQLGGKAMAGDEAAQRLGDLPDWRITQDHGVDTLVREFRLPGWGGAMAFANRVAALADEQDHHPAMFVEWGRVTLYWWTHKIGGLHQNDFIMAARSDALAREMTLAGD